MIDRFTEAARAALLLAQQAAHELGHPYIGTEHILIGLIREGQGVAAASLRESLLDEREITERVIELCGRGDGAGDGQLPFTPRAKSALDLAMREALQMASPRVDTAHVLLGILRQGESVACMVIAEVVLLEDLRRTIVEQIDPDAMTDDDPQVVTHSGRTSRPAGQVLATYTRNLTTEAADGKLDPVIGRDEEIEQLMEILVRRTKNNPVLVGEAGVGKTAVVEGLARRIACGDVPDSLRGRQVHALDLGAMIAGTKYRGEFEERMTKLIHECSRDDAVVLFVDEIHALVGAGSAEGSMDAASMLKPALARGDLRLIGATTLDEYRRHIERDPALERRFAPVRVDEPSIADTIRILEGVAAAYEEHHGVRFAPESLRAAAELSDRFIRDRQLPDKAIDLIDRAAARRRVRLADPAHEQRRDTRARILAAERAEALSHGDMTRAEFLGEQITTIADEGAREDHWRESAEQLILPDDIADVVARATGIPVGRMGEAFSARLAGAEQVLSRRVIGQADAVAAVCRAVRRARAGLGGRNRPAGSFLFLGPSGVGKTELARALAEFLFGDERAMISIDMSEYMEKHAVARLIGSPPGYVGHESGGQLSEQVRRNPYAVVLLDEIEKAHPDVADILLQILDEGRLTDSQGREVDFRHAVVIMTSNAGAQAIAKRGGIGFAQGPDGLGDDEIRSRVMADLSRHFRPELLNRIDETIVFHPLSRPDIDRVLDTMLRPASAILAARGATLVIDPDARALLHEQGFDPAMGARPLRRAIERLLEAPLADLLLSGAPLAGMSVHAHREDDHLLLTVRDERDLERAVADLIAREGLDLTEA